MRAPPPVCEVVLVVPSESRSDLECSTWGQNARQWLCARRPRLTPRYWARASRLRPERVMVREIHGEIIDGWAKLDASTKDKEMWVLVDGSAYGMGTLLERTAAGEAAGEAAREAAGEAAAVEAPPVQLEGGGGLGRTMTATLATSRGRLFELRAGPEDAKIFVLPPP